MLRTWLGGERGERRDRDPMESVDIYICTREGVSTGREALAFMCVRFILAGGRQTSPLPRQPASQEEEEIRGVPLRIDLSLLIKSEALKEEEKV